MKGLSAYSKHANVLLEDNDEVDAFLQKALAATLNDNLSVEDLIALTMETGKYGVSGMAMLDKANTDSYGNPEITKVNIGVRKNPGILVSGHDLRDLEMLLEQTQELEWMCIRIPRCCQLIIIPLSKNILTLLVIMGMLGGNKKKNLNPLTVLF